MKILKTQGFAQIYSGFIKIPCKIRIIITRGPFTLSFSSSISRFQSKQSNDSSSLKRVGKRVISQGWHCKYQPAHFLSIRYYWQSNKEWDKRKHLSSNIPDRRERRKAVCKKNGITTKNYQQVIFPVLYIPFSPTLWIEIGQIAPVVSLLFEATSGWKDFLVTDHVWGAPLWRVWQLSRQFPSTRATWRRHDTSHLQGTH